MKPDNPERLNFFQRTGRQFDSVGPLGKALLVVYYAVGFTAVIFALRWLDGITAPYHRAFADWLVSLF